MFKRLAILMFIASPAFSESITIDIPDAKVNDYYQTYAIINNWQPLVTVPADPNIPDDVDKQIPNPISIKQNFLNQVADLIRKPVVYYKTRVFEKTKIDQARAEILAEKIRLEEDTKLPDPKETVKTQAATIKKK